MPKPLLVANWKMFGAPETLGAWLQPLDQDYCHTIACPPFPLLSAAREELRGSACWLGAQDCHHLAQGPHTGSVSPRLLAQLGCGWVILGHSERRQEFNETPKIIHEKANAVIEAGLSPILCLGESAEIRERHADGEVIEWLQNDLMEILPDNLATRENQQIAIAYEPVWAIGSGTPAGPADIAAVLDALAACVATRTGKVSGIRFLYGGSVSADNAVSFLDQGHAHGLLVGGLSTKPAELARTLQNIRALA
ncbi:MAG: triose-phosphate isomerase [Alphaproteobacteria bacterium]